MQGSHPGGRRARRPRRSSSDSDHPDPVASTASDRTHSPPSGTSTQPPSTAVPRSSDRSVRCPDAHRVVDTAAGCSPHTPDLTATAADTSPNATASDTSPNPNLALLPDATLPSQWLLCVTDDDITTRLLAVAAAITAQAPRPAFTAGLLRTADFDRALLPYADIPDLPRPLQLPVDLAAVTDGGAQPTVDASPPRWLRRQRARRAPQELRQAAADVVAARAMSLIDPTEVRGWAPLFTVEQGDKHRLIYDLRQLNASLADPTFQMETLVDLPLIAAGCRVGGKLDLKSAFWQVPVAADLRRYLATDVPGMEGVFAWDVLPMGLSHSPRLFTDLLRPLLAAWRARGMRVLIYLDDIGLFAPNPQVYAEHADIIVRDLAAAGLIVSPSKAFFAPLEQFEFLGLLVNLPQQSFIVPTRRIERIAADASSLAAMTVAPRTDLQALLGRIGFAAMACPWLAYYRAHLGAVAGGGDGGEVRLTPEVREELRWWAGEEPRRLLQERHWAWTHTRYTRVYATRRRSDEGPRSAPGVRWVQSDASEHGVGIRWQDGGDAAEPLPRWLWDAPSAARELYGMCRAVERGLFSRGTVVRLVCDAQAAVFAVNGPSVAPSTARVARRLFEAATAKGVILTAEWLPREQLDAVDAGSRVAEADMAHAMLPRSVVTTAWNAAWGRGGPEYEPFTDIHNRSWPTAERHGSHHPMPGTTGDALADLRPWLESDGIWCNAPFAIWRPVVKRLLEVHARSPHTKIVAVLPDTPLVRERMRGWRVIQTVDHVLAPPRFVRSVPSPSPAIIFASPTPHPRQSPSAAGSRRGSAPASRVPRK